MVAPVLSRGVVVGWLFDVSIPISIHIYRRSVYGILRYLKTGRVLGLAMLAVQLTPKRNAPFGRRLNNDVYIGQGVPAGLR